MKIRNGFVSNSSSSSFVVKGFVVETDRIDFDVLTSLIQDKFPALKERVKKYKEQGYSDNEIDYEIMYDLRDKDLFYTNSEEDGAPKGCTLFGQLIEDTGTDDYLHDHIIDCTLDKEMFELQEMLRLSIKGDVDLPVKIVIGTRMC